MSENQKRKSAEYENCTVRMPGYCRNNTETTVYAHLNMLRFGKGMGKKSRYGAYACYDCHAVLDGAKTHLKRVEIEHAHMAGVLETLDRLAEKGIVSL